jgi:polyhydroxyalkanoate synthase subunit PhaC
MPRPLPAHLASATLLWMSSRAALTSLASGWPRSNAAQIGDGRLAELADDIARLGPEVVGAALDREIGRRAAAFVAGLEAYRRHPFHRPASRATVRWQQGSARLLDYGGAGDDPVVLIAPSLINRYTILDLLPERSFVRYLARAGLRPLVLDWGEPGEAERGFNLSDYITGPLADAAVAAAALAGRPVALVGYCMGGLLSLALALHRPAEVACLALLATPWDFQAERELQSQLLAPLAEWLPLFCGPADAVPVGVIQSLFVALDPFLAERKFVRFAGLDMQGAAAKTGSMTACRWPARSRSNARGPGIATTTRRAASGRWPAHRFARARLPCRASSCCRAATRSCRRARPSRSPRLSPARA